MTPDWLFDLRTAAQRVLAWADERLDSYVFPVS
jgi:hypothetical protein